MKDQEAQKEIERLERRIRDLEENTRVGLTEHEKNALNCGGTHVYDYGANIQTVVELILAHLGCEVEYVPSVNGYHRLRKKKSTD